MDTHPCSDHSTAAVDEAYDIGKRLIEHIGTEHVGVSPWVVALAWVLGSLYRDALDSASRQGPEATEDVRRLFRLLWRLVVSEERPLGHA